MAGTVERVRQVGRPLRRREDDRLLRGLGRFVDDVDLPGTAHVAFVRSAHAHAGIAAVDASRARALPGVLAVVTAADVAGRVATLPYATVDDLEVAESGHPVLAAEDVRYVGQPIAAVVAEGRAVAEDAAELVDVAYDRRAPTLDPRASGERLTSWSCTAGDVDAAFDAAPCVVRRSFRIPRLAAAPLELRGAVASYDAEGDMLTMWCSAQDPHRHLDGLARVLGRDRDRIRVVVADTGGAFGSKGVIGPEHALVCLAALDLGRPVKWIEDRRENFAAAYQGRGEEVDAALAVAVDGRMLALQATVWADLGAFLHGASAIPAYNTAKLLCGCYAIPAAAVEIRGMATNKVPTGPYRGAGRPEAAFALEQLVDMAAAELSLDPVELRRRNLVREFPYETALGWTYDSGDFERCLELAVSLAGEVPESDGERVVGTGVALAVARCAGLWESAEVERAADGRVIVRSGSSPHGQGHVTTFSQIVADELGVDPANVVFELGDSGIVPPGIGTFASRSVAMGGSALVLALRELREQGGDVATVRFSSPMLFSSGAYAAIVEIDRATGMLRVVRVAAVDDAGTIVNPLLAEGQVVGATAQAVGQCLAEEIVHDADGVPRALSLEDYALPTAVEMPQILTGFVESPSPHNPLGAKGIGEAGLVGAPAAIANAVAAALGGVRVDPPFTAERLWHALHET